MHENYIALAVPIFLVAVLAEGLLSRGKRLYRFGSSLADLSTGITSVVVEVFVKGVGLWVFAYLFRHHRLVTFDPGSIWPWVIGLVGVDLLYYWWHRCSHVVNALWAVHGVHHQSEDFNFAVALRQPAFESLSAFPFYAPLAIIGVDPVVFAMSYAANLFYQFWIHTEFVRNLGPLEWVLNTPSHHRVHHGINPQYLDRNYGGVLILWDRMFGSFEPEREPVVYGVTKPLASYNPIWANFQHWVVTWRLARAAPRVIDKVRAWFAHPAWRPEGVAPAPAPEAVTREQFVKYDPRPSKALRRYTLIQFWVGAIIVGAFFVLEGRSSLIEMAPLGIVILLAMAATGGLIEGRPWAVAVDLVRQLGVLAAIVYYLGPSLSPTLLALSVAPVAGLFALLLLYYRPAALLRTPG